MGYHDTSEFWAAAYHRAKDAIPAIDALPVLVPRGYPG